MRDRDIVALAVTSPEGISSVAIGVTIEDEYPVDEDGAPVTKFMSPLEARLFASIIMDSAEKAEYNNTLQEQRAIERRNGFRVIEGGEG